MKDVKVILGNEEGYRIHLSDEDYEQFQIHLQNSPCTPLDSTEIEELASLACFASLDSNGRRP